MLKETAVVVPLFFLLIGMKINWFAVSIFQNLASIFRILGQQSEVQPLERRRAFSRQFFSDALLFFETFELVTARASVLLDFRLPFLGQFRIVHERGIAIRRWR